MPPKLLTTFVALASGAALAAEPTTGIPQAQVGVIKNRLFLVGGHVEASLSFATSINNRFTQVRGGLLTLDYNFNEWLGIELDGLYDPAFGSLTGLSDLAARVREKLKVPLVTASSQTRVGDEVSQMGQLRWGGDFAIRFAPVYGKMSVFAEVPLHFSAYLLGGGGAGGIHYESLNFCVQRTSPSSALCQTYRTEDGISPMVQLGVGLRVFVLGGLSLKLELRDFLYGDKFRTGVDLANGDRCQSNLSDQACGTPAASPGIAQTLLFAGGAAYVF